jgi:glycosyltransferase involved in cell wall biosynthesis
MIRKVKVVHLISSLKMGGAETVLYQLASSLDKKEFQQSVIYFHEGPYVEKIRQLGIPVYQVSGLLFRYDPIFLYRLVVVLKHLKPDCLHTVLWAAGFWGRIIGHFLKIPVVHACHNTVAHNGFIRNSLDRISSRWVSQTVAVSDRVSSSIVKQAPWMQGRSLALIKNGIDIHKVFSWAKQAQYKRSDFGFKKEDFVIGAVGRFEYEKNFGQLLTSFALLYDEYPHAQLVLIGSGSQERFLRMRSFDLGVEDRVLFITHQQAYGYYPLFDCFVSTSFTEGLSVALLEAMSFKLPCIVCSVDGKHELIENGVNGLVVSLGDADQLARAIGLCLKNKTLRNTLGQAAYQMVEEQFTAEAMVKEYANLYKKIIQKRNVLR